MNIRRLLAEYNAHLVVSAPYPIPDIVYVLWSLTAIISEQDTLINQGWGLCIMEITYTNHHIISYFKLLDKSFYRAYTFLLINK